VKKAVITVPSLKDFYFTPHRASALGARVLARELEGTGWDSTLINLPLRGKAHSVPLPSELNYLREYLIPSETGPLSWFKRYRRFGPINTESIDIILNENPDAVFISSFAWAYAQEAMELAEELARSIPEIPIIIGGHGPSSLPEYFLKAPHPRFPGQPLFSLVVVGEVEGSGKLLSESIESEIRYLDLRNKSESKTIQPIAGDSIHRAGRRSVSITLTRGCPRKCRFCSNYICHGREFRSSPPEQWEEEINRIVNRNEMLNLNLNLNLNIEDDNILFLKKDFFRFLISLKKRYPGITFTAENGLDYMLLDEKDINWLKEIGFTRLNLSLGVLSEQSRSIEHRDGNPEKLERIVHAADKTGLPLTTHFICGLAGDSKEDIIRTLLFLDNLPCSIGISNFYPVPGLEGFTDSKLFLKNNPRLALGSSVYPWNNSLSSSQMITAFRLARWSNFQKKWKGGKTVNGSTAAEKNIKTEHELYQTIKQTNRLHTIIHSGEKGREREIVPVPHLDASMVEAFFQCPG